MFIESHVPLHQVPHFDPINLSSGRIVVGPQHFAHTLAHNLLVVVFGDVLLQVTGVQKTFDQSHHSALKNSVAGLLDYYFLIIMIIDYYNIIDY